MRIIPSFTSRACRGLLVASLGAASLLSVSAGYGQTALGPAAGGRAGNAPQVGTPVDPQSLSCTDLKEQIRSSGQLTILSGPRGNWGDTFYGPAVPQCPFWQIAEFTYVRARDGLCGVGFICVDKNPMD
jgi:hypothetical protein